MKKLSFDDNKDNKFLKWVIYVSLAIIPFLAFYVSGFGHYIRTTTKPVSTALLISRLPKSATKAMKSRSTLVTVGVVGLSFLLKNPKN
jgi:hypothetical protein